MKKIKILSIHLFVSLFIAINFSAILFKLSSNLNQIYLFHNTNEYYDYNYEIFFITAIIIGLYLGIMKYNIFKLEILTLILWPFWYFLMGFISSNDDFHSIAFLGLEQTIPIFLCVIIPNALVIKLSVGKKVLIDAYWEERKHWVK